MGVDGKWNISVETPIGTQAATPSLSKFKRSDSQSTPLDTRALAVSASFREVQGKFADRVTQEGKKKSPLGSVLFAVMQLESAFLRAAPPALFHVRVLAPVACPDGAADGNRNMAPAARFRSFLRRT